MTIRSRNRITFIYVIISLTLFVMALATVSLKYLRGTFDFPDVYIKSPSTNILLAFNPHCVVISILILLAYSCTTSYVIYRSFEKSQATEMFFFLFFLAACMIDSIRIAISTISDAGAYSNLLLKMGNITLFARLLAPLSLFGAVVLSDDEYRQNADRNCLIIIITALFFSEVIPLNSAIILPNFSISYGYVKAIHYLALTICILCIANLFITNFKNEYNQMMTLGFSLLCLGYSIIFESYNILTTITGPILLGLGTTIYISEVHKHYLWQD